MTRPATAPATTTWWSPSTRPGTWAHVPRSRRRCPCWRSPTRASKSPPRLTSRCPRSIPAYRSRHGSRSMVPPRHGARPSASSPISVSDRRTVTPRPTTSGPRWRSIRTSTARTGSSGRYGRMRRFVERPAPRVVRRRFDLGLRGSRRDRARPVGLPGRQRGHDRGHAGCRPGSAAGARRGRGGHGLGRVPDAGVGPGRSGGPVPLRGVAWHDRRRPVRADRHVDRARVHRRRRRSGQLLRLRHRGGRHQLQPLGESAEVAAARRLARSP